MSALRRWVLAAGLLVGALPAQAVVGGTNTGNFKSVGYGTSPADAPLANGIQITDNWVLTATHVGFGVGSTFTDGWGSASVAATYGIGGGAWPTNDLMLLRLATPISAAPILQLDADVYSVGVLAQPVAVTITTARNQSPQGYAYSQLQEVTAKADAGAGPVDVNWLIAYTDGSTPYVQDYDSGGGLFLGHVTDSSALMGITSARVPLTPSGYGSAFMQVAYYRAWIDSTMASDLTDSQTANWISAVPEPSSWVLLLAGGALLAGVSALRQSSKRVRV